MKCENNLWRITLDTNPEDCNYHCVMCEEHSEYSNFKEDLVRRCGISRRVMPLEWIDGLLTEAASLGVKEVIPSTMGEPLLYPGIDAIFEFSRRHGLKVNLTTNGSFPRKSIDEWSKQIVPVTRDIKVSINGARKKTSESIMRGSDFDEQIRNIRHLVFARNSEYRKTGWYCSVTLQLTFMQNNMSELVDMVKQACNLGVDRIKGHHLWAHFKEIEHLSMKANLSSIKKWNQYVREAHQACYKNAVDLPNGRKLRLENVTPLPLTDRDEIQSDYECPFLGKELWVSATGRISPCCCPDAKRRTLGDFGRYPSSSLCDVLQSAAYKNLLNCYKTMNVCRTCNMRKPL
jgi:MoaA/NifB/PqqE/SkfB family radical SAM enzyme